MNISATPADHHLTAMTEVVIPGPDAHIIPLAVDLHHPRATFAGLDDAWVAAQRISEGPKSGSVLLLKRPDPAMPFQIFDAVNQEDGPFHGQPFRFEADGPSDYVFHFERDDVIMLADGGFPIINRSPPG